MHKLITSAARFAVCMEATSMIMPGVETPPSSMPAALSTSSIITQVNSVAIALQLLGDVG